MKKFVIIGCGGIGSYHLDNIKHHDDIVLAGFCDLVPSRAERLAAGADIAKASNLNIGKAKVFTDFRKMYDAIKPDGAFVCVPPYRHGDIEFESIDRGIAMFVEKPLAIDLGLACEINRRIAAKNLIAASGFQCRYSTINAPARQFICENPVITIAASRVGGLPAMEWINRKEYSGGQLVEQTIHQVDILRYLIGEVDTVFSVPTRGFISASESPGYDIDDASVTIMSFKSGITASMTTGCYALDDASWDSKMTFGSRASRMDYRLATSVTIYGAAYGPAEANGLAQSGDGGGVGTTGNAGGGTPCVSDDGKGVVYRNANDYGAECDRAFIDAVISGDPSAIRSPYADALKSVALVLACNESMDSGQPVKVKYAV